MQRENGGLDIGLFAEKNQTLLDKWLQSFLLEVTVLWGRAIKSKYGITENGWNTMHPIVASSCALG